MKFCFFLVDSKQSKKLATTASTCGVDVAR
jgi:hypothetical protein